jgi:hypothetical protein
MHPVATFGFKMNSHRFATEIMAILKILAHHGKKLKPTIFREL